MGYRDALSMKSAEIFIKMRKPLLALMELELVSEGARSNTLFKRMLGVARRMCRHSPVASHN